jgi:DNA primase
MLDEAQTVVDYVLEVLTSDRNLEDPKVKAEIVQQILPLIEDVADPVEREAYRQNLARRLRLDERALMPLRPKPTRRRIRKAIAPEVSLEGLVSPQVEAPVERFCLGVLLHDPELLYRIDRQLQALELGRVSPQDFTGTDHRVLFQLVRDALAQDEEEPIQHWRNQLEPSLIALADSFLVEVAELDFRLPKVLEGIMANFLRLRKRRLELALTHLRFQLQAVQDIEITDEELHEDLWHHTREVQRIASQKERLDRALSGPSSF